MGTVSIKRLKDAARGKRIILMGATTSARDVLETVLPQLGAKADYVCDLKLDADSTEYLFENDSQEIFARSAEALKKDNPSEIFVLITTLFDNEAAELLDSFNIENYMSAREILNETVRVAQYWNERYKKGYDTGVQTTGFLLDKQVELVNAVIDENNIEAVFELGCGNGKMLPLLRLKSYAGVDISEEAIRLCKERFKSDGSKRFYTTAEYDNIAQKPAFDLALSLGNVIPSLPDDSEYIKYMNTLFGASKRFVCIFSSDFDSERFGHIKARNFSRFVSESLKAWRLVEVKETGYAYKAGDPLDARFFIYEKR